MQEERREGAVAARYGVEVATARAPSRGRQAVGAPGAWLLAPALALGAHALILGRVLPAGVFRQWLALMLGLLALRLLAFAAGARGAGAPRARRVPDLATLAALGAGFGGATLLVPLPGELWVLLLQTLWLAAVAVTALPVCPGAPRDGLAFALPALLPAGARLLASGDALLVAIGLANLLACALPLALLARAPDAGALAAKLARQTTRRRRALFALREAQRRVRALSSFDPLTGLANRREFERVLEREWARARRERRPVSLVLCDIDRFGHYLECYGPYAGDRCLERIGAIVAARSRRAGDLVARYGAGEFVLLLPGASEFAALDIADSIRSDVLGLTLLHGASDAERVVTVSCGVATLTPGPEESPAKLLEAAANALGRAKREGRNRVCAAGTVAVPDAP